MKSKTQLIKQAFIVLGLMVGAITILNLLPAASASGFIKPEDNIVAPETGGETSLRQMVLTVVNYFLGFLGLLAVVMIIFGGITYVSSAGNDDAVGKAKKIIMYALVGIVIILLSFVLVNAVLGAGTGTET